MVLVAVRTFQTCPTHSKRLEDSLSVTREDFANPAGSPTLPPAMQQMPPMQPPMQPPDWAAKLISDVKAIKSRVSKIEDVQKTVNQICVRIQDLETNVTSIDSRLSTVENSCSFIGKQYDDHKKELTDTKSKLNSLKGTCAQLENKTKSLESDKSNLEAKLVDLEYRSMRDNLMFYGVAEQDGEDCEYVIKNMIQDNLDLPRARNITFDRVHRVGLPARGKTRPIVAKFHYYKEREMVGSKSFEYGDRLKAANLGIGTQCPKQIRDARKLLYAVMEREKTNGKSVKLVRDKLYINGTLYKPDQARAEAMATETA